jgi:hypothetical protein
MTVTLFAVAMVGPSTMEGSRVGKPWHVLLALVNISCGTITAYGVLGSTDSGTPARTRPPQAHTGLNRS